MVFHFLRVQTNSMLFVSFRSGPTMNILFMPGLRQVQGALRRTAQAAPSARYALAGRPA
jgi:hypothetical protein